MTWTIVGIKNGVTTLYPGISSQANAIALGNIMLGNGTVDSFTVRQGRPGDWGKDPEEN